MQRNEAVVDRVLVRLLLLLLLLLRMTTNLHHLYRLHLHRQPPAWRHLLSSVRTHDKPLSWPLSWQLHTQRWRKRRRRQVLRTAWLAWMLRAAAWCCRASTWRCARRRAAPP
jgi:hypothetical protein